MRNFGGIGDICIGQFYNFKMSVIYIVIVKFKMHFIALELSKWDCLDLQVCNCMINLEYETYCVYIIT